MQLGLFEDEPALPALMDEAEFTRLLLELLDEPCEIKLTSNRSSLISVRIKPGGVKDARIQRGFLAADKKTMKALARFVTSPTPACRRRIDEFLALNHELVESMGNTRPRKTVLKTRGLNRDLKAVMKKVIAEYGLRAPGVVITWSTRNNGRRRRTIKFGSFCQESRTVRIHPDLDRPDVPDYFVEYIVYHELLHAIFPPEPGEGGRRKVHNAEFKRYEKKFARYEEALAFERRFVNHMIK